jgi:hypothetical protein
VKIKAYRKTGRRLENNRLEWFRDCVLNGKNVNTGNVLAGTARTCRDRLGRQERLCYSRTERSRRSMLEQAGTGGISRIRTDRQDHAGTYMNLLEQPE